MTTLAMVFVALVAWPLAAVGLAHALRAVWRGVADRWWRRNFDTERRLDSVGRRAR